MTGHEHTGPDPLLETYVGLFTSGGIAGPVLDLACGRGHNGVFLAGLGLQVILCDASAEALRSAGRLADRVGVAVTLWQADLEAGSANPFAGQSFGGILAFHYLHRPLIPHIRASLTERGILIYKTFTIQQARYGRPRNPNFLLQSGELRGWFQDWEVIHYWEGIKPDPERAVAELVCRKTTASEIACTPTGS